MQINRMTSLVALATSLFLGGCSDNKKYVQCVEDSNCDLSPNGVCVVAVATGHKWCAHPDPTCPSGIRYEEDGKYPITGDGLSGVCVAVGDGDGGVPDGGGTTLEPASCAALPHTCGAVGTDSCCTSLTVSGGTFFRDYNLAGDGDKFSPATISSFRLDKYEVTVGRFRAFMAANEGTQAKPPAVGAGANAYLPGSGWQANWNQSLPPNKADLIAGIKCSAAFQTWTDAISSNENRPMNCLTWFEAAAFCAWDGGFLPTEAEWNYAAAGGDQQRAYPWSSPAGSLVVDHSRASYNDGTGCIGDEMPACTLADLLPVGSKPAGDGRFGQSDLSGNVEEWVLDWPTPYMNPCTDCANLVQPAADPLQRAVRSSDFEADAGVGLRTGYRGAVPQGSHDYRTGVRCARAP